MKKTNNKLKYILGGGAVLVAGAAIIFSSGNLFQGKLGFKYCDLYPNGVSEVISWVPTQPTTSKPPSGGATPPSTYLPPTSNPTPNPTNQPTYQPSPELTPVPSKVPCNPKFYEEEMNPFVHPAEEVGPPVDDFRDPLERAVQPVDEIAVPIDDTLAPIDDVLAPFDDVAMPIDTAVAPIETIEAPIETFAAPIERAETPIERSAAPTNLAPKVRVIR